MATQTATASVLTRRSSAYRRMTPQRVTPQPVRPRPQTRTVAASQAQHLGMMQHVDSPHATPLLDSWDRYFNVQSALLGPQELALMQAWGFGRANHGVLDVGCGNATHGLWLAAQLPQVPFYGLDANQAFLQQAQRRAASAGIRHYALHRCDLGTERLPTALEGRFTQCLLRLVLQHTGDPVALLSSLYAQLPSGGQVFVVEEDDGFYAIHPPCRAYYRVGELLQRVGDAFGSRRFLGREVPSLLQQAGFRVRHVQVLLQTNLAAEQQFLEYLQLAVELMHHSAPDLVSAAEAHDVIAELGRFGVEHRAHWFGVYPQVLAVGEKAA